MNNYEKHAWREFRAAGWCDENHKFNDDMQELICKHILKLLEVFADEGHTGFTAPYTLGTFKRLAMFEPIAPLTGEDSEWNDVGQYGGGIVYQNNRLGSVFKEADGRAYWSEGRVFWEWHKNKAGEMSKTHFTNRDSRVYIEFPWVKPESPEYVFVPTEEFPDEVL